MSGLRSLVVSIHDVAPATLGEAIAVRATVDAIAGPVPVSLLAVPRYHGQAWHDGAAQWLRDRVERGDEAVLHGLVHMDEGRRDGAEFARRDSVGDTIARLAFAHAELRGLGVHAAGFVAPAYAHPPALGAALATSGLEWWATRNRLVTAAGASLALPSVGLGASTLLKRALSPAGAATMARALARAPRVRLDLHPADMRHRRLTDAVDRLLTLLMEQGRTLRTHGDLVGTTLGPWARSSLVGVR